AVVVIVLAAERALADVLAEVRGVGAAAAVAAQENHAPVLVAVVHRVRQGLDLGGIDAEHFLAESFQKGPGVQFRPKHERVLHGQNQACTLTNRAFSSQPAWTVQPQRPTRYNEPVLLSGT